MPQVPREVEIKIALKDRQSAAALLRRAGFRVLRRRVFEVNVVFDRRGSLRRSGRLLRLRVAGSAAIVTYKEKATIGRHKVREELEFGVTDAGMTAAVLERLGFEPAFRYEKYRTEFARPGTRAGIAMIDHTPIGDYLELEGPPKWIDRTAGELGYSPEDYDTRSYGALYLDWCRRTGTKPSHMIFAKERRRRRA